MRICLLALLIVFSNAGYAQPQKEVKTAIDSLLSYLKNKATESFAKATAYQGSDEKRKWKETYNPENAEELKEAKKIMQEMTKALNGCNYREFDTFKEEKESEGTWYIYTYACGSSKKIHLAFLKINKRYVLGDIDVEDDED